jgi:predicted membrane-bound mannosyltransferase
MIQRIQSVWLLAASIVSFLTLKLSFYSGTYLPDNLYHQLNGTENLTLMIPTIALGILTLITIFLFKNRVTQLRLCIAGILLDVLLIVLYFRSLKDFSRGDFAFTAVLHLIVISALVLAASGINKDEKLIKDSNRLR